MQLFDGANSPQNIATYGFLLGATFGGCLFLLVTGNTLYTPFFAYVALLTVFHQLEYVMTALWNRPQLSLDSFLLNHSPEYHVAHLSAFTEYWLEWYFFPAWKLSSTWNGIRWMGFLMAIAGQSFRTAAMHTAQSHFKHVVATEKLPGHTLVKHGVYRHIRHPSYLGFFLWAVGTQLCLLNPMTAVGFAYALYRYFDERVDYEEVYLHQFFGNEYGEYQVQTPWSGLPWRWYQEMTGKRRVATATERKSVHAEKDE